MTLDDVYSIRCRNCKYFKVKPPYECKRWIFPDKLVPYHPWFSCDREGSNHIICSEFEPAPWCKYIYKVWTNYDEYYSLMRDELEDKTCTVFINGDFETAYVCHIDDFIYGWPEGKAIAYSDKLHYRRTRESPFGYVLDHSGPGVVYL